MCGICGVARAGDRHPVGETTLVAMRDALEHRGPDDAGHHLSPGIALGSRRLAILDLSRRGRMPMSTPDGRYWIVYNGEVYNYRELRTELQARGYNFRSDTDTEVVLNLYVDQGPEMLGRLNGMFAFAVWDGRERTLFLARDRLGVKPLYYAVAHDRLYFASEEKALFAAGLRAEFDPEVWEELLCFRHVAGESTPYAGVKRLLPGHSLTWKNGRIRTERWWNLSERVRARRESLPPDPAAWFRSAFDAAVHLQRISDVPIGVLLSGGLDSGSVAAALALENGSRVRSFTVRFEEPGFDEGPLARGLAARYDLDHHELCLTGADMAAGLRSASWLNDEPLARGSDVHLLSMAR